MAAGPHPDRSSKRPGGGTYTVQAGPARPSSPPHRDRSVRREPRGAAYYAESHPSPLGFVAAILAGFALVVMVLLYLIFAGTDPDAPQQPAAAAQPPATAE
jgi:hypothetical protein